jgi:hypothetical protein
MAMAMHGVIRAAEQSQEIHPRRKKRRYLGYHYMKTRPENK